MVAGMYDLVRQLMDDVGYVPHCWHDLAWFYGDAIAVNVDKSPLDFKRLDLAFQGMRFPGGCDEEDPLIDDGVVTCKQGGGCPYIKRPRT